MRKTHTEIHLRNEPEHGHKEYKYLYQQMLKDDVIRKAYKKLRKGKTKRKEIQCPTYLPLALLVVEFAYLVVVLQL